MGANGIDDYYVLLEFFKNHTSITFGWIWFKISSKDIEKDKTLNIYGHLYKKYGLKPFEEIEYLCARLYYRTKVELKYLYIVKTYINGKILKLMMMQLFGIEKIIEHFIFRKKRIK